MDSPRLALIHLLIVADQHQTANQLISWLRQEQIALRAAHAATAAELARQLQHDRWDLVVCYQHSTLALEQVLATLHKHEQQLPVVFVTTDKAGNKKDSTDPLPLFKQGVLDVIPAAQTRQLLLGIQRAAAYAQLQQHLRRLELAHHELEQRYDTLLATSATPLCYLQDGVHLYSNDEYAHFFGYDNAAAIATRPFLNLLATTEREAMKTVLRNATETAQTVTVQILCADNSEHPAELQLNPVDYHGKPCVQLRVTPAPGNPAYSETVARLSTQDLVTRVANREHFMTVLDAAIRKAVQLGSFSTLIVVDIADFDEIKTAIGTSSTNFLLNDIAEFLQSVGNGHQVVGRIAEAQFGLLLDSGNPDETLQLVTMIRERCNSYLTAAMPTSLALLCDVGMALINGHAPNADTILTRARHWLAADSLHADPLAQQQAMPAAAPNAKEMLDYLAIALREQRFILYFQPIVHIKGGSNHGYEVLVRMLDDEGNEIRPGAFLPLAILNGMGEDIDRMVLELVVSSKESATNNDTLVVNITSNTLASKTFLPWLGELLQQRRFPASRLVLELSEIDFHANASHARGFCQGAGKLGLKFALSHFGTAVEPFAILDKLKPSFVTLDESVVRDLIYSAHQKANVQALIESLHQRGMLVAAPQVEDMDVLPVLWAAGADFVQGYCLQAPTKNMNYAFVQEEEITLSAPEQ
ncbi:MAG TPA: GGDEF domain-containing protein [Candidatus Acidoferrum sp.]|nr:GGDEF domain-containing protein [Candidatus Acidoferrum sp.]